MATRTREALGYGDEELAVSGDTGIVPLAIRTTDGKYTALNINAAGELLVTISSGQSAAEDLTMGGRLTLTTALPVTTSDVTAATSIFYTPYIHDLIPIHDGSAFVSTTFTELTLPLDSTGDRLHAADTNYDLFVFKDAGTLRLGTGVAWTSDTGRGTGAGTTELARLKGIWTNAVTLSVKFGTADADKVDVSVNRATYVGTMRATANGQTEDSLAKRFLWNTYNRVLRPMLVLESTDTWTYSTATFRQRNNSTANQLDMVRGLNEDAATAYLNNEVNNSSTTTRYGRAAIGLDSTTAASNLITVGSVTDGFFVNIDVTYHSLPGLGRHFLAALEQGSGAETQTWRGDVGSPLTIQVGLSGSVFA